MDNLQVVIIILLAYIIYKLHKMDEEFCVNKQYGPVVSEPASGLNTQHMPQEPMLTETSIYDL